MDCDSSEAKEHLYEDSAGAAGRGPLWAAVGGHHPRPEGRDSHRAKEQPPPPGFTALFNGKDLTGWQGLVDLREPKKLSPEQYQAAVAKATAKAKLAWTVQDGILHYNSKANNLQTAKDYGNFELYVDWKIGKKGDSGIYLRGNPQVQIWDNPEGSGGLTTTRRTRASRWCSPTIRSVNGTPSTSS